MLCWSDGRAQFMLYSSLHGEKSKVEGKEQGMKAEQHKDAMSINAMLDSMQPDVRKSIYG